MKTIEAFMQEVAASEALQQELKQALDKGEMQVVEGFFKAHGCELPPEGIPVDPARGGELSDEELDDVSGGGVIDKLKKVLSWWYDQAEKIAYY